ncbi:MAG: toll/interleukin-1 receptor domain-containing protein [Desulfobacterales bacterium]|nr:toll/interleukin-1 receptor domain-containing protein [Desulfobacterales bacterium]
MVRNRIFISYSHKDKEFFDELLIYLKPWQDRCIYDVWTDQAIRPGQDWHQEIQQAIDSTAVAVLLTSQYFMASDYIRDYEVPLFLKACEKGKLTLTCLHLWKSSVDQHPFAVTLDNGQTQHIKLSRYQSLNDPKEPLASQSKACQNETFGRRGPEN